MIIKKIDPVHGGVFPGAAYNEKKVLAGVAELAGHANIDGNFLHTLHTFMALASTAAKKWSGICKAGRRPMATRGQHNGRCTSPFPARDRRRTKSSLSASPMP